MMPVAKETSKFHRLQEMQEVITVQGLFCIYINGRLETLGAIKPSDC